MSKSSLGLGRPYYYWRGDYDPLSTLFSFKEYLRNRNKFYPERSRTFRSASVGAEPCRVDQEATIADAVREPDESEQEREGHKLELQKEFELLSLQMRDQRTQVAGLHQQLVGLDSEVASGVDDDDCMFVLDVSSQSDATRMRIETEISEINNNISEMNYKCFQIARNLETMGYLDASLALERERDRFRHQSAPALLLNESDKKEDLLPILPKEVTCYSVAEDGELSGAEDGGEFNEVGVEAPFKRTVSSPIPISPERGRRTEGANHSFLTLPSALNLEHRSVPSI